MLNILAILLIDPKALGALQSTGPGWMALGFLTANVGLKLPFSYRAYCVAGEVGIEAGRTQESVYLGNARGARVVTVVCGVAS